MNNYSINPSWYNICEFTSECFLEGWKAISHFTVKNYDSLNFVNSIIQTSGTQILKADFNRAKQYTPITAVLNILEGSFLVAETVILIRKVKEQWDYRQQLSPLKVGGALLGVATLSAGIVWQINLLSKSILDPQEIFNKTISLAAENASVIQVSMNVPLFHSFNMWLRVNPLFIHIVSVFFSSKPHLEIGNAFFKGISVFNLSQMKWLNFKREDNHFPLLNVPTEGYSEKLIQKIETNFSYIIPRKFANDKTYLESAIQNIYDYNNRLFHNSFWSFHQDINVGSANGQVYVRKEYYFHAFCKMGELGDTIGKAKPFLIDSFGKVFARTTSNSFNWYKLVMIPFEDSINH